MRIFITTPSVKSGSSLLAWLIKQHSYLNHTSHLLEQIELGAMLNVLDHIPSWRKNHGEYGQAVGNDDMVSKIVDFSDSIINPNNHSHCMVKFTNFTSYNWLSHIFPNDKIIVIVRNIYDWYASIKVWNTTRHDGWDRNHIDGCMRKAAYSLSQLPHIKIVHFEDILADPFKIMAVVHDYLELPIEPISLVGHEKIFNGFSCRPDRSNNPLSTELFKSPLGRSTELTPDEFLEISKIMNNNFVKQLYMDDRRLS